MAAVGVSHSSRQRGSDRLQVGQVVIEDRTSKLHDHRARRFSVGKLLGKGGFARVYEFTDLDNGQIVAGKVVEKRKLLKPKSKQKLLAEIKIQKGLSHERVVKFESFFEDRDNVYILLERCKNHSMMELLKRRKRLTEDETRYYLKHILEGVQYLHERLLIHRDLKLGNIFLDDNLNVKIGDFGLAAKLDYYGERKKTICGTPNYIAPEILEGSKSEGHSFEVDVWSIGVILYTMLVGKPPFETTDVKTTYRKIRANRYSFPSTCTVSANARRLITKVLQKRPESRPKIQDILSDAFFTQEYTPSSLPISALYSAPLRPAECVNDENVLGMGSKAKGKKEDSSAPKLSSRVPLNPLALNKIGKGTTNGNQPLSSRRSGIAVLAERQTPPLVARTSRIDAKKVKESRGLTSGSQTYRVAKSRFQSTNPVAESGPSDRCVIKKAKEIKKEMMPLPSARKDAPSSERENLHNSIERVMAGASSSSKRSCDQCTPPNLWVVHWADFSSKYGLAYKLSNGTVGAHYNDSTKMLLGDNEGVDYYDRKRSAAGAYDEHERHSIPNYPTTLNKKITLIQYFRKHFDTTVRKFSSVAAAASDPVYVKRWLRTKHAIIFRLSNKSVQVIFYDKTEIILSSEGKIVTFTDSNGNRESFALNAIVSNPRPEIAKRLRYTKEILYQLIDKNGK